MLLPFNFSKGNVMKNLAALIALILFVGNSSVLIAQSDLEDVVYLKNGSIIRGVIIEQVPNKSIKIQTRDGNIFAYAIEEVERITKEGSPRSWQTKRNHSGAQLSSLIGYGTEDGYNFGLGVRIGASFSSGAYLGGVFVYHLGKSQDFPVPYYGNVKLSVNTLYVGPEFGYDAMVSDNVAIRPYTSFGYFSVMASVEGFGSSESDSEGHFYVAPGLLFNVFASEQFMIGVDSRYVIITGEGGSDASAFGIFLCLGAAL